jgi:phage baseplate assembly protein W
MSVLKEPTFKDIPLGFNAHPLTGNIKALENTDAVKQSVRNIVLTNFYERPYNSIFGGNIRAQLFENMDVLTEYNISKDIRQALDNFEPRAIIDDIKTQVVEDRNALNVTIRFRIKNNSNPITVGILLERVR